MPRKRMFDDKATWRTADQWGIDPTQPARAERIFDPNDSVTNDPSAGGIGGGTGPFEASIKQTGQMYTDQQSDPTQAVRKAYVNS